MRQHNRQAPNTLGEHETKLREVRERVLDWSIRIASGTTDPFGKQINWSTRYVVDTQHQRDVLVGICTALGRPRHRQEKSKW